MAQDREKSRLKFELPGEQPESAAALTIGGARAEVIDATAQQDRAVDLGTLSDPALLIADSPPWGPISFMIAVVLPAFAALLYLFFVATPQFVSESRFIVRGSLEKLALESFGQAALLSGLNNAQEAHVIADYVRSPQIVGDLAKEFDLKTIYAGAPLDVIWGLSGNSSADRLARHWQRMVTAEVDTLTGIITVRIHAFRADDAQALNRAVIKLSETLIAGFAQKMRIRQLEDARSDSEAARAEVTILLDAIEAQRGRDGTIDPLTSAAGLAKLVAQLRDERATLLTARAAAAARLAADAPTLALTDERIRSLDTQIALVLDQTGKATADPGTKNDLVGATTLFDFLQIRREVAIRRVARAEAAFAQARQDLVRQHVYIDVFLQPTRGETVERPRPFQTSALILLGLAAIWAIGFCYFKAIEERGS